MNDDYAVKKMIDFIEGKERELQQRKLLSDQQAKNDTIKAILDKLEEVTNENQKD